MIAATIRRDYRYIDMAYAVVGQLLVKMAFGLTDV
jgi:hypothetical protein